MQTLNKDQLQLLKRIEGGQNWFAPECSQDQSCTMDDYRAFQETVAQLRQIRDATYIELIEHEVNVSGQTFVDRVETVLKF